MGKFIVLSMSVLLMIAAVVFILFSDKIDMAAKGGKQVKNVIVTFGVGVVSVCTVAIIAVIASILP